MFTGIATGEFKSQIIERELGRLVHARQMMARTGVELLTNRRAIEPGRLLILLSGRFCSRLVQLKRHRLRLRHFTRRTGGFAAARGVIQHKINARIADGAQLAGRVGITQSGT